MTEEAGNTLPEAAETMLDSFASVGADRFVLTWRTLQDEDIPVRKHWSAGYIRRNLPQLLAEAERRQLSVIIRPSSPRGFFLQLDDLNPEILERVRPVALLMLATSPGKAQAWLFVEGKGDTDADRDFRRRVKKACAADLMASGAVRLAGSLNFKPKYAPNFPCVVITHASPGRMTSRERLGELGLVAPQDIVPASRERAGEQTLAGLPAVPGRRAPEQRRKRARSQPRRLPLVQVGDRARPLRRGDGRTADGTERQGARSPSWQALRPGNRAARRGRGRAKAGEVGRSPHDFWTNRAVTSFSAVLWVDWRIGAPAFVLAPTRPGPRIAAKPIGRAMLAYLRTSGVPRSRVATRSGSRIDARCLS